MIHKSQTARHKSRMTFVPKFPRTSEDESRSRWFDFNAPETQFTPHHKPTAHLEEFISSFKNAGEYTTLVPQKQVYVKSDFTASYSVSISKVGASPKSLVAAVELLVSIVGENKHQSITSLTANDYQRLAGVQEKAQKKLIDVVSEDENLLLTSLINFIDNLIKICSDESNPSADLLPQETNDPESIDAATLKPHHPEKVGRPATLSRLKLADLLSQETNDPESIDAAILKPHRPEKVGRPATLPRLKLADLLSQETDDLASGEVDTGPAVGNEVW
jgi:hypothetical protein